MTYWHLLALAIGCTTAIHPQMRGPFRSLGRSRICCVLFSTFVEQFSRGKGTKDDSLRAGGATDLFIARAPYFTIKKIGRWSRNAAMVYYRHDEDVIREVSTTFQLVANPTSVFRGGHTTSSLRVTSLQYRVGGSSSGSSVVVSLGRS